MPPRILIIGQGLAGTALAWRLWERGVPFLIVDRDEPLTSSKVAAGLITPITGMRLTMSWRYDVFYREALRFYRACGKRMNQRFFFPRGYVRLLKNEPELTKWHKRRRDPDMQPFLHRKAPQLNAEVIQQPENAFQQRHAAWLDTTAYLESSRRFFESLDSYTTADVKPVDVRDDAEGVEWHGQHFSHVIWAQGWSAEKHPLFHWVPFQSALGTILTVQADLRGETRILNRGCWLLPRHDDTLRAGSTYEWQFDDPNTPSADQVQTLKSTLQSLLKVPAEITATQTAVRPIIKNRQALMGTHPTHPRVAFLNGLGSKGSLRSPWLARHLIEHLLDGTALDAEMDLQQNGV
ncbi:FAD-dependent oxidoreductase [Prosthecobacter sp.]|uniref:NAD(P)/FAD-dependent oxidoreductase n=1 Tax=Prosthecobacter sp. TaxID=1965333 RepID=UPI002AB9ED5B|nr:FAD-dependent oxidoreductase [Prosthecobacter sp.]MDZ4402405.1 FAD-dependent oxidoreductase [Prosthecobacter sp.]